MKMSGREISALFLEHCSFSSVRLKKKIKVSIVEKKLLEAKERAWKGKRGWRAVFSGLSFSLIGLRNCEIKLSTKKENRERGSWGLCESELMWQVPLSSETTFGKPFPERSLPAFLTPVQALGFGLGFPSFSGQPLQRAEHTNALRGYQAPTKWLKEWACKVEGGKERPVRLGHGGDMIFMTFQRSNAELGDDSFPSQQ